MKKTALIVCNGEPPAIELMNKLWQQVDLKICADGGANFAVSQGFMPDAVIGDMDSLLPDIQQKFHDDHLIRISEQETNDGDKALRYCIKHHIEEVHLLGASGRRSDQFLANLELLDKYGAQLKIILWTELERIEVIEEKWQETLTLGTTLSLLPLFGAAHGITTQGLKYPLKNATLQMGKAPSGISNVTTAPFVCITLKEGKLLLIIQGSH